MTKPLILLCAAIPLAVVFGLIAGAIFAGVGVVP
jgi:hypothetical protein